VETEDAVSLSLVFMGMPLPRKAITPHTDEIMEESMSGCGNWREVVS